MTDEERWEQALSIARGTPSPPALDRQRRSRRNLLLWGSVIVVVCVAAGAVAGFLIGGSDTPRGDDDGWRLLPEPWPLVAFAVGLGLEVTGFVLVVRAGQWGARWKTASSVLTRAQRRGVLRQMRGRALVVPEQLPVVVDLARRVALTDRLVLVFAGLLVLQAGNIGDQPSWLLALLLLLVSCGLLAAGPSDRADHRALEERGAAVEAVATRVEEYGRNRSVTLSWTTAGGRVVQDRGADVDGRVVEGQRVAVVYDPEHPEDYVVGAPGDGYLALLGLGALLGVAGAAAVARGPWSAGGRCDSSSDASWCSPSGGGVGVGRQLLSGSTPRGGARRRPPARSPSSCRLPRSGQPPALRTEDGEAGSCPPAAAASTIHPRGVDLPRWCRGRSA